MRIKKFHAPLLGLVTLGCGLAGVAFANDAAPVGDAESGVVTVTGKRSPATPVARELADYGTEVQVITAEQIDQSGAINFAEAAQFLIKGVNVGYSPDEGEFTIRLDGGGDRDTLVTLDGTPLYDRGPALENIWGATTIDPHMIENIEVFRGGNSLYFGSNGGIGVVNVITKKPDGTRKGEFGVSYGSFATREVWGNYSFPLDEAGHHSFMFYGSMLATDGPRIFDPSKFTDNVALAGGIQDYPLNKNHVGAKYLWQIDENTQFRANVIYTESWFQDPFPSGETYSPNTLRYPIADVAFSKRFNDRFSIEASAYYSNPELWNAELYPEICKVSAGCVDPNTPTRTIPYGAWTGAVEPAFAHGFGTTNQYRSGFKETGATVRATINAASFLETVVGVQYVSYADDSDERFATPDNDSTTTGVFVDFHPRLPFSPSTNISIAIRQDFSEAFDSKTVWKFGFKQPIGDFYLRANGGTSYSLPQTNELYINNPRPPQTSASAAFTVVGNPDLETEETETYNLAAGYQGALGDLRISTEIGAFDTEISNRIRTTSGRPIVVNHNGTNYSVDTYYNDTAVTKIKGLTVDADVFVGEQWSFGFAYTAQDAAPASGPRQGIQINETPEWFVIGKLNWESRNGRLKAQLLSRTQGPEWATGGPAEKFRHNFGDYTVVNGTLTYLAGKDMEHRFQLRVANLFDTEYAERYGYGNNFYGVAFNRGEYTNTDDRYFYGYPFEGKPRSFYFTYSTQF
ncbi:TonB-denpendent receptor [Asticcacaulis sp. AC460]|uniref:TonB-dependent receptor plug domain-containing protein n=1 Tax=Asticcacaulis sp. AC460 TaxID=1282360 RepID=UPI0003C4029D|nr:TonB-dependent receptor plug domain-containing protein [Asticcacaulis sp. AC460]ESQ89020.1 TonB-denpendent receptor [Asticcacaulis sp. AC460]